MKSNAQKFIDCLNEAKDILDDYPSFNLSDVDFSKKSASSEHFNLTLIEQWSEFCEPKKPPTQPVRLVQHLSCTGGTLISKCLAAMPNTAMLSEVNPLSSLHKFTKPKFAPSDLISLASQAELPFIDELKEKIFKADIAVIAEHLGELGKYLVIREHSHSDYLVGHSPMESSTVAKLLNNDYPVLAVVTVRHPVDSYLSLLNNGWVHFSPKTFNEYCGRYLLFVEHNRDVPVFKYEDFVGAPDVTLKNICERLNLPFNQDFLDVFDLNRFTGDSGRTSSTISKRERREIDQHLKDEINESDNFRSLCAVLAYNPHVK